MNRVLITGGRGFIGHHCLAALIRGGRAGLVHVLTSSAESHQDKDGVQWHHCDLMEPLAVDHMLSHVQPTHLLHFAWVTTPGEYWTSPRNEKWSDASRRLLDGFIRHGGQRVVVAGTCAEYDWSAGRCLEGHTPLSSSSPYARSKNQLREDMETLSCAAGISSAWGRVFFAYGPGEPATRLVPSVIRSLLSGEPAACSEGLHKRDFIHVADLGEAFVKLLDSDVQGPVNLGSGKAVAIADLTKTIGRLMGGGELVRIGARSTSVAEPPLVVADTRRLHEEVGFSPRFDLETGLKDSIEWWRRRENRNIAWLMS